MQDNTYYFSKTLQDDQMAPWIQARTTKLRSRVRTPGGAGICEKYKIFDLIFGFKFVFLTVLVTIVRARLSLRLHLVSTF